MQSIPVIDVAALRAGPPDAVNALAEAIGAAARDIGFFTIRNHGIEPAVTARMYWFSTSCRPWLTCRSSIRTACTTSSGSHPATTTGLR